ncbi:MAG: ABC transporter substrate-binding protein [Pigmentiphaga sp.]|uniref:ABC transporter substrate-binding protein n=1 Tax=Pigmentiphaga sp. TaxID=1977564 RepID=UPI0029BE73A4|nr:ABC transporter substrate-binding protein [Pigmentiphaga sp.]MDX3904655.1 ABC transporter substrate-binding protein [Pigmentiphaga sp.]
MNTELIRLALGLRSTAQSLGMIGRDTGAFERHGVDLHIVREETAGPEGARMLLEGECDAAEFGAVPVVQNAFEGKDPVIVLAAEQINALHVFGARGVIQPQDLIGRSVGVLTAAGQTGVSARQMLARWQLDGQVELEELKSYPAIYAALREGRIAAGVLSADYGIAGSEAYGFSLLADLGRELGYQAPVLAVTRRTIAQRPQAVQRLVAAYVDAIARFKADAEGVAPIIERHLGFVDRAQALAIQRFYAPRFQAKPYPSEAAIQRIIDMFAPQYPRCAPVTVAQVYDPSFLRQVCPQ